jgi:hypothetical protein
MDQKQIIFFLAAAGVLYYMQKQHMSQTHMIIAVVAIIVAYQVMNKGSFSLSV